jgi:Zn ribbon nucleic-acid-binding protein
MHEYSVKPNNFKNGTRCPQCFGVSKKTTEIFKNEVFMLVEKEYEVLGTYLTNGTKIKMKHVLCGHEWNVRPSHFLIEGSRCPKCSGRNRTTEDYKKLVYDLVSDEYEVLGEYQYTRTPILMKHVLCNYTYEASPNNFLRGKRCPKCIIHKGEMSIAKWLDTKNINYRSQYRFDDCKDTRPLPFDFAIFENENLIYLIEFDGGQHFEPVKYFGGEEGFKDRKKKDGLKNEYCKKNNIPLLRIPYWDFDNIEEILNNEIGN